MKIPRVLLASAAIAAGGVGYYGFVGLYPEQTTAIVSQGNTPKSPASTTIAPVQFSGESNDSGYAARDLNPEIGTARVFLSEKAGVIIAHELPPHNNRPSKNESFQASRESAPSIVRSDRVSTPPIEERPATLPSQPFATRALVASTPQPQQPRAVEPSQSVKPQPSKTAVIQIPATVPDAKSPAPTPAPRKPAGAIASTPTVNLPAQENPLPADSPSLRLPKFLNEEAELYRTQYGEEAYAARMHEAALSP